MAADFVSDTLLVVLPLLLLWNVTLPRQQRRLILILFSASILTFAVSVVHAVFLIGPTYLLEGATAEIEVSMSPSNFGRRKTHKPGCRQQCLLLFAIFSSPSHFYIALRIKDKILKLMRFTTTRQRCCHLQGYPATVQSLATIFATYPRIRPSSMSVTLVRMFITSSVRTRLSWQLRTT